MKYYYVPSTYRGKRFGSGIRGGAVRGYGCLVAGTLSGGYLKTYAEPAPLSDESSKLQEKVVEAEATGNPVSIGSRLYNFGKKLVTNPVSKALMGYAAVEGSKALLNTPTGQAALGAVGSTLQKGYDKVKDYFAPSVDVAKEMTNFWPDLDSVLNNYHSIQAQHLKDQNHICHQ